MKFILRREIEFSCKTNCTHTHTQIHSQHKCCINNKSEHTCDYVVDESHSRNNSIENVTFLPPLKNANLFYMNECVEREREIRQCQ